MNEIRVEDMENGFYLVRDGSLYKVTPRVEMPLTKTVNLITGEVHYPTNYDRLISKSPEELAEFFQVHCCPFELCGPSNWECKHDCRQCWLDWLKQEVANE